MSGLSGISSVSRRGRLGVDAAPAGAVPTRIRALPVRCPRPRHGDADSQRGNSAACLPFGRQDLEVAHCRVVEDLDPGNSRGRGESTNHSGYRRIQAHGGRRATAKALLPARRLTPEKSASHGQERSQPSGTWPLTP